jgi:GxxExxY protein
MLAFELWDRGIKFERQKALPLVYRGYSLDYGYRIDLLVEDEIIVEAKSIEQLLPVRSAQLLSYLRLMKRKLGLLINFNVKWLTQDGIKRIVNGFPE